MDYWEEVLEEALGDVGIVATREQITKAAKWLESAHNCYGAAMGHECIPNPETEEIKRLESRLKIERSKIPCRECGGRGRIHIQGPYHGSESRCDRCNGEGKHTP